MDKGNERLTISQLSSKLNVSGSTLRFWEKEFAGILVPLRTDGGQRRYNYEHIAVVKKIHSLKKAGHSLNEIKGKLYKKNGRFQLNNVGIDLLAERVAGIVKMEILKFFKQEGA